MSVMRIAYFNCNRSDLEDPVRGRPFANNGSRLSIADRLESADYIHCRLDRVRCNEEYEVIAVTPEFQDFASKFVFFSNHDHPKFAYRDQQSVKILAQPIHSDTPANNIVVAPLQMHDFEWALIQDTEFIHACRRIEKMEDLVFIGQAGYGGRQRIISHAYPGLKTNFRVTKPIWHIQDIRQRLDLMRPFLLELARSRFSFCPRGMGSSSFRFYQSLMVGTVPIISGFVALPFADLIDYTKFCIFHNVDDPADQLLRKLHSCDYDLMREHAISVWETYFHMKQTDRLLFDALLERLPCPTER